MKKGYLVLIGISIISLLALIGFEYHLYLKVINNDNHINEELVNNDLNEENKKEDNKIDETKYLVDITTPYNANPLTYEEHTLDNNKYAYYISINGLKNKDIQNKINNKIKEKVEKIAKETTLKEYTIHTSKYMGFENTLSLDFYLIEGHVKVDNYHGDKEILDTLNVDLNTGDELTIEDIVNNNKNLKSVISKEAEESIAYDLAYSFSCYNCEELIQNCSHIEESVLSIINAFDRGDYFFSFGVNYLALFFNNVYIYNPIYDYGNEFYDECQKSKKCTLVTEDGYNIYKKENYNNYYTVTLDFVDMIDFLTIYNKFKNDNIFEKNPTEIKRKFNNNNYGNYENYFEENNSNIYDMTFYDSIDTQIDTNMYVSKLLNKLKSQNSKYNVYYIICNSELFRGYACSVQTYHLNQTNYEKYYKQIYKNGYISNIIPYNEDDVIVENKNYDFLEYESYTQKYYDANLSEYTNKEILTDKIYEYIPDEWLSLGKYKTKEELVNNMDIFMFYSWIKPATPVEERLTLDINYTQVNLNYYGNKITLYNTLVGYINNNDGEEFILNLLRSR